MLVSAAPRGVGRRDRSALDRDRLRRGPAPRRDGRAAARRQSRRRVIRQAALYLATDDDVRAAGLPVAGRPVAFRSILAAIRAGAERVAVPAALRSPDSTPPWPTSPTRPGRAGVARRRRRPRRRAHADPSRRRAGARRRPSRRLLREPPGRVLASRGPARPPRSPLMPTLLAALRPALVSGAPLGDTLVPQAARASPRPPRRRGLVRARRRREHRRRGRALPVGGPGLRHRLPPGHRPPPASLPGRDARRRWPSASRPTRSPWPAGSSDWPPPPSWPTATPARSSPACCSTSSPSCSTTPTARWRA